MSAIKGAKKVGFPVGATAALATWALSRKPGHAHTTQKAGLRARGDRHRQAPLLWCLPSGSPAFQRGMSRVMPENSHQPKRRRERTMQWFKSPGSAQRRDCDVGSASIFCLGAPGIPKRLSRARQTRHDGANRQGCDICNLTIGEFLEFAHDQHFAQSARHHIKNEANGLGFCLRTSIASGVSSSEDILRMTSSESPLPLGSNSNRDFRRRSFSQL